MTVTVRFAPAPTGRLHIGNVRTAVLNWLYALRRDGRFLLRLDDTDALRSSEMHARAIIDDLAWLGIVPDETFRQSERLDRYRAVVEELRACGLLYPCYETERELALKRKAALMAGRPPVYDRAALRLTAAARRAMEEAGRVPHWRFRLPDGTVRWRDAVRGEVEIDLSTLSDPVLVRADGSFLYTLPSVVDDMDYRVTHVIRGDDHVTNTAVQLALFHALGAEPPAFAHHSLLVDKDGGPLSKRLGSLGMDHFRDEGLEPETIVSYCGTIASALPVRPWLHPRELADHFDLAALSRAPARFDEAELLALNARLLHEMPWDMAAPRLRALGIDVERELWETVRGNITRLREVAEWRAVVEGDITPPQPEAGDRAFLATALERLPPPPWTADVWKTWIDTLKKATGRKGRALFMPLRKALTGREKGPEMSRLMPLIGPARVRRRLRAVIGMPPEEEP